MANQNTLITKDYFFSRAKLFSVSPNFSTFMRFHAYLEVAPVIVRRVTSIRNLRFVFDA